MLWTVGELEVHQTRNCPSHHHCKERLTVQKLSKQLPIEVGCKEGQICRSLLFILFPMFTYADIHKLSLSKWFFIWGIENYFGGCMAVSDSVWLCAVPGLHVFIRVVAEVDVVDVCCYGGGGPLQSYHYLTFQALLNFKKNIATLQQYHKNLSLP